MENSIRICKIAQKQLIGSPCPSEITFEMLALELDCEDLRSRLIKNDPITKDELWKAYSNVNSHMFIRKNTNNKPTNLFEIESLINVEKIRSYHNL